MSCSANPTRLDHLGFVARGTESRWLCLTPFLDRSSEHLRPTDRDCDDEQQCSHCRLTAVQELVYSSRKLLEPPPAWLNALERNAQAAWKKLDRKKRAEAIVELAPSPKFQTPWK